MPHEPWKWCETANKFHITTSTSLHSTQGNPLIQLTNTHLITVVHDVWYDESISLLFSNWNCWWSLWKFLGPCLNEMNARTFIVITVYSSILNSRHSCSRAFKILCSCWYMCTMIMSSIHSFGSNDMTWSTNEMLPRWHLP